MRTRPSAGVVVLALLLTMGVLTATPAASRRAAAAGNEVAAPPISLLSGTATSEASPADDVAYRSVAHHADGRPVRRAAGRLPRAIAHYTGFDGWEPTLGLTRKGHIFTPSSVELCCSLNTIIRSRDGGRTWADVSPKLPNGDNTHFVSADPYLYVDPATDRIFAIDLTLACSIVSFSDDGGDTWTTNPIGCGAPLNDHQTLFAGPPATSTQQGYPNVVYYCYNNPVLLVALCSKSLDGGATFEPTGGPAHGRVDPASNSDGVPFVCGGTTGHGVVGPDGSVYLPRVDCDQPWLAISRDEGRSWERVQVASNGGLGHEAGLAVDGDGNLYMVWTSDRDNRPYLARSRDRGKTWSVPVMVGPPGLAQGVLPGIAAGARGEIAIVYVGTDSDEGDHWNGYVTTTHDALSPDPLFYTAAIGSTDDPLSRGACLHRCDDLGDFFDVVIARDGTTWAAFADACFRCKDENDAREQGVIVEVPARS